MMQPLDNSKVNVFLIPPFLGQEPSYFFYFQPRPCLLFFHSSRSACWEEVAASEQTFHGFVRPAEKRRLGAKGVFVCLWQSLERCSHLTLHLQMSSCYIWWPPSGNRCTLRSCSSLSVFRFRNSEAPTAEWKLSNSLEVSLSLIHMHLIPGCVR